MDKHIVINRSAEPDDSSGDGATRLFAADPFDDRSEPFFELRDRLFEEAADHGASAGRSAPMRGIIGILSPDAGDGRSHVAANLAAVLAHGGARTLLIDGDLHHPRLHTLLRSPPRLGFRDLLSETHDVPIDRMEQTHVLSLLTVGSAGEGPSVQLQEPGLRQLLEGYRSRFDCVVLDTPPASRARDALLIAACCDVVVIVGRKGRTRLADLKRLINRVSRTGARIGGVILNGH